ncbi:MAG: hypothetical protein V4627_11570 [Pseudomonadota bacterium]
MEITPGCYQNIVGQIALNIALQPVHEINVAAHPEDLRDQRVITRQIFFFGDTRNLCSHSLSLVTANKLTLTQIRVDFIGAAINKNSLPAASYL